MGKRTWALATLAAATLAMVGACSGAGDSLTGPRRVEGAPAHLLGGLVDGATSLLIAPVKRTTPLANDISWSFTVGSAGGSSSNAASGLTISVPSGAVSTQTTITVTALAGSEVAYGFQPHGFVFAKKVYLTQDLRGTSGGLLESVLSGAHFSTDRLQLNSDGLALVTEIVPALTNIFSQTVTFGIGHFSGWIVATGRATEEASEGQ